ncbi:Neur_chan_LBD domain-containing protein [Gammaproteobacteria bacterium]
MRSLWNVAVRRVLGVCVLCVVDVISVGAASVTTQVVTPLTVNSRPSSLIQASASLDRLQSRAKHGHGETSDATAQAPADIATNAVSVSPEPPINKPVTAVTASPAVVKDNVAPPVISPPPEVSVNKPAVAVTAQSSVAKDSAPKSAAPDAEPPGMKKFVPFPPNVTMPIRVGVSLFVSNISKINEATNTFEGQIDLLYHWYDPRLAFDIREVGTNRLEFGYEAAVAKLPTIWNPRVTITNMIEKESQVFPGLFIHADGKVEFIQRIKATFETKFALAAFPFDTQSLLVVMLSSKYNASEIDLVQDPGDINTSGLDQDIKVKGWKPQGISFKTSRVRAWNGESLRQMESRVAMQRAPSAILASIFTPFLLLLIVPTIITFFAKSDIAPRLTAWSGSILALVALNFTFSIRYPWLGSDSLVSQVVTSGHVYQLISVLLTVTLLNPPIAERMGDKFIVAELVGYLRWVIPFGFLALLAIESLLTAYSW